MKLSCRPKTLLAMSFLLSCLMSLVSRADPVAVGTAAPAITGTNQDGKTVDLGALYKTGYVLVYFYPKAETPGCTAEACSLRDAFLDLTSQKLTIVGVSHDDVAKQKDFATQYKLPFDLLADTKGDIYKAFGVPGAMNRQSFLVKDGTIVWRELKASTKEQADDVKKALAADKSGASVAPASASAPVTPTAATPSALSKGS
jgi:thioredoxin-dependent peroxiredoxin